MTYTLGVKAGDLRGLFVNVGHRGFPLAEPENTIRSFLKAFESGATAIEMDVRATADGHLVLMHDESVDRTTDGHGLVSELTLRELKSLDAGKGERVPTLSEALSAVRGRGGIDLDLKVSGYAKEVVKETRGLTEYVYVTSSSPEILLEVKEEEPGLRLGLILKGEPFRNMELAREIGASAVVPRFDLLTNELMRRARELGLEVYVWTVNTEGDILRALSLGVDGIITDNPPLVARILRERAPSRGLAL